MKSILVTGGAGFLGSHLCKKLLEQDTKVTCLDNLYTGSISNILSLEKNKNFNFIEDDIVKNNLKFNENFDEIYNLACPASPIHYQKDPIYTLKTCILGSLNILNLAKSSGAKVFQASTSEVYGSPNIAIQSESYWGNVNPIGIRSCYDEGKRAAETAFFDFSREYGLNIKVARIFNTYGPNMSVNDGRVVSNFINQALNNIDITVYGDGLQTRSFCYVDDLIDGFIRLMDSNDLVSGPVNLGNPSEFTMLELAEKILRLTESNSKISFKALPEDDPTQRKPDINKAKELLGWEPSYSLDDGLPITIDYFKGIRS